MKRLHDLKTWPDPFKAVQADTKRAEFRRYDRGFKVGDMLHLREWNPSTEEFTGNDCFRIITDLQTGFDITNGYVMISIRVAEEEDLKEFAGG